MASTLRFCILGPLRVTRDGETIVIARGRPKAVLGSLLLAAGETLSVPRLVDSVWGPSAPSSADNLVRVYVSQLRRDVGEDVVATRPGGYAAAEPGDRLDALQFRHLVSQAAEHRSRGDANAEAAVLDQALALWSGDVLADVAVFGDAAHAAAHLNEVRMQAVEERADVWLRLGRHRQLVPELEHEVAANPARERLVEQLMLALYRCGRQTEALDLYATTRHRLVDDLGLDPSPRLQRLQARILRHDPALEPSVSGAHAEGPRPRRRLVAAAVAVVGAVAVGVAAWSVGRAHHHALVVGMGDLVRIDPIQSRIARVASIGGPTAALLVDGNRVWLAARVGKNLDELDSRTLSVKRTVALQSVPHAIASDGGALWLANGFQGTISRLRADAHLDPPFRPQPHSVGRLALAAGATGLWIGSQDGRLTRLDPRRLHPTAVVTGLRTPQALALTDGAVWIAQATSVDILRVDETSGRVVARIPIGGVPSAMVAAAGSIWALAPEEGKLWRIEPRRNSVVGSLSAPGATLLATDGATVWVADSRNGTVTRVMPRSNTLDLGHPVTALAGGPTGIFATTG